MEYSRINRSMCELFLTAIYTQTQIEERLESEYRDSYNALYALNSLPSLFAPLIASMQEQQKWAYQEGNTQILAKDVITFFPFV